MDNMTEEQKKKYQVAYDKFIAEGIDEKDAMEKAMAVVKSEMIDNTKQEKNPFKKKMFNETTVDIPFFKSGTHKDSAGNTTVWTNDDLDKVITGYNPAFHEAPLTIGHPADNKPAYGWVKGLERQGNLLVAKVKDVTSEVKDWVDKGLYKKVSGAFYPDKSLRHIGLLGGEPPAIKGLPAFAFKEGSFVSYELTLETKNIKRVI